MPGYAHARLRQETRDEHAALDALIDLTHLASRVGYLRYLRTNWVCVALESALTSAGIETVLPDWKLRRRHTALAADFACLEAEPPLQPPLVIATGPGALLGYAYVLEGSRLGAKVILRLVCEKGDIGMQRATHFLRHGDGASFWHGFKENLKQIDNDKTSIANACASAKQAFTFFQAAAAIDYGRPLDQTSCRIPPSPRIG